MEIILSIIMFFVWFLFSSIEFTRLKLNIINLQFSLFLLFYFVTCSHCNALYYDYMISFLQNLLLIQRVSNDMILSFSEQLWLAESKIYIYIYRTLLISGDLFAYLALIFTATLHLSELKRERNRSVYPHLV